MTPASGTWASAPSLAGLGSPALASGYPNLFTFGTPTASTSAVSLAVTRNSTAAAFNWAGERHGAGNGNWSNSSNWTTGGASYVGVYPGLVQTDTASIDLAGQSSPTVTIDAAYTIASLSLLNAGTLTLNGASGNALTVSSGISVASGQTLGGTATLSSAVAMGSGSTLTGTLSAGALTAAGATITPGTAGTAGTITAAGLSATGANRFNFDIGTTSDLVNVTGNISALNGTIVLNPITGYTPGTTYTLFDYGGNLTGGVGGLTLNTSALPTGGLNAYYTYALSTATANEINIVSVRAPNTFTWANPTTGDMVWTDSGDWTSNNGLVPSPVDSVVFGPYNTWSTYTVNLPTGTTTVNNLSNESMWTAFNFTNASATLDVTGNFASNSDYANTFAPVLDLTGQFISTYGGWNGFGTTTFSNNGNTIGGGINSVYNEIVFSGNNNTINGGITVTGVSPNSYALTWGFGSGGVVFTGSGNAFSGVFNLERDGYVIMQRTANLSNVTAINFNGGVLELGVPATRSTPASPTLTLRAACSWATAAP